MKLSQVTRMTRSSSPKYPTVRAAYIGSVLAAAFAVAYDFLVDENFDLWAPVATGVAAFLGWAIARELDPDHPSTALVALAGAGLLAVWHLPYLLVSVVALGALRLVAGTVGGPGPTTLDLVVMVAFAGYAGWYVDGWALAMIIVVGILISGGRSRIAWALAAGAAAIAVALVSGEGLHPGDESFRLLTMLVVSLITVLLARPVSTTATTDIGKLPLDPQRLRLARFLAALGVAGAVLGSDVYAITNLGPLSAAVVATAGSAWLVRPDSAE